MEGQSLRQDHARQYCCRIQYLNRPIGHVTELEQSNFTVRKERVEGTHVVGIVCVVLVGVKHDGRIVLIVRGIVKQTTALCVLYIRGESRELLK